MARRARTSARIDCTNRPTRALRGLVLAGLLLSSCAPAAPASSPAPSSGGPIYPTPTADGGSPSAAAERPGTDDHDHDPPPVAPPPAVQAAPVAAAFARAWARPDLSAAAWWRGVSPSCEGGFARALRSVDPARVPATRVTGRPVATRGPAGGAAVYDIATDAGTLTVTLAAVGGRWLVTGNDFTRRVS
jgi:hypothetical protein